MNSAKVISTIARQKMTKKLLENWRRSNQKIPVKRSKKTQLKSKAKKKQSRARLLSLVPKNILVIKATVLQIFHLALHLVRNLQQFLQSTIQLFQAKISQLLLPLLILLFLTLWHCQQ